MEITVKVRRVPEQEGASRSVVGAESSGEMAGAAQPRTGKARTSTAPGYWQTYHMEAKPTDRILDVLMALKSEQDGTLTFRRSCGHGICGSDAIRINGKNRLACKTLVKDLGPGRAITLEPLKGLPVVKDLVVDMEPFLAAYRSVLPYLIADTSTTPTTERLQSPQEHARFEKTTKCILCAACTTSCPVLWTNPDYTGPMAMVNAHRFVFDSRDVAAEERFAALSDGEGVWRCRTTFNCTEACPRDIPITEVIGELKRAMIAQAL
jgi:succinate dehydrogenase / fumarate reductase iron-sulfur subunit